MSKFKNTYIALFLLVICLLSLFLNISPILTASAEEDLYSNVLDDLKSDQNFKQTDYQLDNADFSLKVIQVAEFEDNLVVYVYQPCLQRDFRATSINISTTFGEDLCFTNFRLTYLNHEETLYKYKVDDFKVKADERRYYEVSSIFRKWNEFIDNSADKTTQNTIDEISFKVAKSYTFTGQGKEKSIFCQDVETIEVVSKYVGGVRRSGGLPPYHIKSCDSHFISFSTDKKIDDLMEADLSFTFRTVTVQRTIANVYVGTEYGDLQPKQIKITDSDHIVTQPLFNKEVIRQRIEGTSEFLKTEKDYLEDETKEFVSEKDWVLRFFETEYSTQTFSAFKFYHSVEVYEVTVLRLKFESNGKVYNLGVVDNKQTGSNKPDSRELIPFWLKIVIIVVGVVVGLILLIVLAPQIIIFVLKLIVQIFVWLFKALWWLITLPFRFFKRD